MRFNVPPGFPKQIRLGILIAALIVIGLELVILFFDFSIFTPDQRVSLAEWHAFKARFLDAEQGDSSSKALAAAGHPASPRSFDPNRLDEKGWMALGFSKRQARSILKYEHSLGGFENKAQIRRSYVISTEKFDEIEPFIQFSKPVRTKGKPRAQRLNKGSRSKKITYQAFDLNTVSASDLKDLPPLRRVATALVAYREMLGGYVRFSQLDEVYHMDSTAFVFCKEHAKINPQEVSRIDINRVDFRTLLRHPYFDYDMVAQVFQLRNGGGWFQNVEQLKKLPAFQGKDFDKIRLYLKSD